LGLLEPQSPELQQLFVFKMTLSEQPSIDMCIDDHADANNQSINQSTNTAQQQPQRDNSTTTASNKATSSNNLDSWRKTNTKAVYCGRKLIDSLGLSSSDDNGVVLKIALPPNHSLQVRDSDRLGDRNTRYIHARNILGPNGFDLKLPPIPSMLASEKDNGKANSIALNISPEYAQRANELQSLFDRLVSPAEKEAKQNAEEVKSDPVEAAEEVLNWFNTADTTGEWGSWSDILVKPDESNGTNHTTVMNRHNGMVTIKLLFNNSSIATIVKAVLVRWLCKRAELLETNEVQQLVNEFSAVNTKHREADGEGYKKHSNQKRESSSKTLSKLREHLQTNASEADQCELAYSVLADSINVEHLHHRFVSLRLERFSNKVNFDDIENCPIIRRTFENANLTLEKNSNIKFWPAINPMNSKIDIVLPEPRVEKLLETIGKARLCNVYASVISHGSQKWQTVELLKAYHGISNDAKPAAQSPQIQNQSQQSINVASGDSNHNHIANTSAPRAPVFTYAAIASRGLTDKFARQNRAPQPNNMIPTPASPSVNAASPSQSSSLASINKNSSHERPASHQPNRKKTRTTNNNAVDCADTNDMTEMKAMFKQMMNKFDQMMDNTKRINELEQTVKQLVSALQSQKSIQPAPEAQGAPLIPNKRILTTNNKRPRTNRASQPEQQPDNDNVEMETGYMQSAARTSNDANININHMDNNHEFITQDPTLNSQAHADTAAKVSVAQQ
jgi:hypothetical protein